ncbi:methyl-accepting chemotaxis protein [Motiliproteus sediminis]|uniref:methyl-accepting chemotaxis protein n=1 Tax=Motiliproteus sediminis TaxID=1468178 RepID=UPI001AEF3FCA|nr:HAMP domain-containing methyl-accepting chemotaxis protein [Motiliproteus sediminis]
MTLTFKRKISLVILIAVLCTGALAITSLVAMNAILKAQNHLNSLREVADSSMELQIELYAAREIGSRLAPDTVAQLETQIEAVAGEYRGNLEASAKAAQEPRVHDSLPPILNALDRHVTDLRRWVVLKKEFGLTPADGLLGQLNRTAEDLNQGVSNFSGLAGVFQTVRQHEKDFLLSADPANASAALDALAQLRKDLVDFDFDKYVTLTDQYQAQFTQLSAGYGELVTLEKELRQEVSELIAISGELERLIEDQLMVQASQHAEMAASRAQPMIIGTGSLALVLIALLLVTTGRAANRGFAATNTALSRVAAGDLRVQLESSRRDEFGDLARSVNQMSDGLKSVVGHLSSSSSELSSMSDSLSGSVDSIARGNQQVAEKATSLAAATEQMSATVSEVAQTTHQVNEATDQAKQAATDGSQVISRALRALGDVAETVSNTAGQMAELGQRTERIDMVIEVIRGVAEQTNLLALNAAIEAARAGEAGRGFAVVADEVRALAEKTVQASDEITEIVHSLQQGTRDAVSAIEAGKERAEQGNAHGASAAEAVAQIEQQVASASSGTDQIAVAIEQLSSTVKEMAANMEEISGAVNDSARQVDSIVDTSQQVAHKATELQQLTHRFQLD